MDKLEFEDTPENRAYFEKYSSDVFNDSSNIVGKPKSASYVENGITYNYTVTIRESFLMGKYGGAKVTTYWDGNRLLTIKISSGKQTRYRHYQTRVYMNRKNIISLEQITDYETYRPILLFSEDLDFDNKFCVLNTDVGNIGFS